MSATCKPYAGSLKGFQDRAAQAFEDAGFSVAVWSWGANTCDTRQCLTLSHLRVQEPIRLAYPYGICVYCGRHAGARDHLLPRAWSGNVQRHFVVTVPACGTCNSLLGQTLTTSITERRAIAHARMRKRFAKVLRTLDHSEADLAELGPTLRAHVISAMASKREVEAMLAWPTDSAYDARALQASGIEDPFVMGLIVADDDPELLDHVRRVA